MEPQFAIVTESTADIPPELAVERKIFTTPMHIFWDGQDLRDGVDLDPIAFYQRLVTSKTHPTTSQPTIPEFMETFERARQATKAAAVLVLTMSARLSGTYNAACQAAKQASFPVFALDTRTGSLAHGLTALALADARDSGISPEEGLSLAERLAARTRMIFALDTLEYLYRSGRVNNLQRLLGAALQIKPILHVQDGGITMFEQVRTRHRQMTRLVKILEDLVDPNKPLRIGILHGNAFEDMQEFVDEVRRRWNPVQLVTNTVCPPVGVHTGPGSLGFALLQES
ncbi:MAG: DegV family protein [Anaerolineae bacterium]|nr:DegV family protein [Anaerolineae bacterium]